MAICETTKQVYSAEEHAQWVSPGTGKVVGEVFSRTRSGDVKVGAGETVWLVPDTAFFHEIAEQFVRGFDLQSEEQLASVVRRTTCNSRGEFFFQDVPAGKYMVLSRLYWNAGSRMTGGAFVGVVGVEGTQESSALWVVN